jgi:arylsulfatase A-like enzyme
VELGFAPGSRPTDRGFDEYLGNISGNCDYYTYIYRGRNDLYRNTEPAKANGYSTFVFADAACDFIERNKNRPFFCYVPFNAAHYPTQGTGLLPRISGSRRSVRAYGCCHRH